MISLLRNPQQEILLVYLKSDVGKIEKAVGYQQYEHFLSYIFLLLLCLPSVAV
jgi:hypothetical protein